MADQGFQEKTEQPTAKKLEEARKKGQVARSMELNSAMVLAGGMIILYFVAGQIIMSLAGFMRVVYSEAGIMELNLGSVQPSVIRTLGYLSSLVVPVMVTILMIGLLSNYAQVGVLFTAQPIEPKWEKISPASGFKRMFSQRSLFDAVKSIIKVGIIGTVGYLTIMSSFDRYVTLAYFEIGQLISFIGTMILKLGINVTIALFALAVIDFGYQKWKYTQDLKMSLQEVKDEYKQTDGDPIVKGRIKRLQREIARKRMMQEVPEADVIITNPTTYAVALKYDIEEMTAPTVVAKGMRKVAEKIKEIALEHDIPIIENKILARALYKAAEVGDEVPFDLYQAVAEVLAYIYRMKNKV